MKKEKIKKELNQADSIQLDIDEGIIIEKNKKNVSQKKIRRQKRNRTIFILWNIISIIFYAISSIVSLTKNFKSDLFSYIIIGLVIVYAIVFIGIVIASSSSKASIKANYQTFKTQIKMWRAILGVFNLVLSVNIFINSLLAEKNTLVVIVLILALMFTLIRLLIGFVSIIHLIFKQKRINKKKRKLKEQLRLKKLEDKMIKKKD